MDPVERRKFFHEFQKRVMADMTYSFPVSGWTQRIVLHSAKMKGWNALPHHFLNLDLGDVWLDKD